MKGKIVFGRWETVAFLLNLTITQVVLGYPRMMINAVGSAAWITVIYVTIIAFLAFLLIIKLYSDFEGKDFLDIGDYVGGSAGRIIVGLIYIIYLGFIASIFLREFTEDMKIITLPTTPISVVTIFFIAGMLAGAYLGLEPLVRLNAIAVPIIFAGFIIISFGTIDKFNINNIFPILGNGAYDVFGKGFMKLSIYSALSLLFFIYPFIKHKHIFKSAGLLTIGLSAICFFWSVFSYILIFPQPIAIENFLPLYNMARLIEYGRFFQRVEAIFVLIWATSALLYLTGVFFFIVYIFKKMFRLEYYKPLILPFTVLIFTFSLVPPNLITVITLEQYFRNYIWLITFILPILLLGSAKIKKRVKKGE